MLSIDLRQTVILEIQVAESEKQIPSPGILPKQGDFYIASINIFDD